MRVIFILPALTEATSLFFRPIKYSLGPPLELGHPCSPIRPHPRPAGDGPGRTTTFKQKRGEPAAYDSPAACLILHQQNQLAWPSPGSPFLRLPCLLYTSPSPE